MSKRKGRRRRNKGLLNFTKEELDYLEYPSMQKWMSKGFIKATLRGYIRCLKRWCKMTGCETPDDLASGDMKKLREEIRRKLKEGGCLDRTVRHYLRMLNRFWMANGRINCGTGDR